MASFLPTTIDHHDCPQCGENALLAVETSLTMSENPGGNHDVVFTLAPTKITCLSCKTVILPTATAAGATDG